MVATVPPCHAQAFGGTPVMHVDVFLLVIYSLVELSLSRARARALSLFLRAAAAVAATFSYIHTRARGTPTHNRQNTKCMQ